MPGVTQPSERPGIFSQKLTQMMAIQKENRGRKFTEKQEKEYEVVCIQALIAEALDKIEYSLRGAIRRGKHKKMGMSESEFSDLWRKKMEDRLFSEPPKGDGYPRELTEQQKIILQDVSERTKKKKSEEASQMAVEALKKVIMET